MISSMANLKASIEAKFGQLGVKVSQRPVLWFIGCVFVIVAIASQLIHLRTDAAIESFLDQDSKAIIDYNRFKELFGRDELFIITVEVDDIFQQEFVDNLRAFHEELQYEVPYLNTVDSLINATHMYGENDTLIIKDLLPETLPADPEALEKLKSYTYDNPTYINYLISPDRHLISVIVHLDPFVYEKDEHGNTIQGYMEDKHLRKAAKAIIAIVDKYQGVLSDDIQISGSQPIAILLGESIEKDFTLFSALGILLVAIVLSIIFRRASGVIMPLVVMVLGVTTTISFMAMFGAPMQMTTSILPSFLLAVCVGDSIHLLTIFYQRFDSGETKVEALRQALEHTGLAMFFTSITTAAGLGSFGSSDLSPVANLGIYGAIGSVLAFLLTIFILPCLIAMLPMKRKAIRDVEKEKTIINAILRGSIKLSTSFPKLIATLGIFLFIGSTYLAMQIGFGHDPKTWLPEDHPAITAIEKTEARMGGTMAIEVLIDTGENGGVNNPAFLKKVEETMNTLETWDNEHYRVAKIVSAVNVVKESNRGLHNNDQAHYIIPDDSYLISQELFLVEMDDPDNLFKLIDRDYRQFRMTLLIPWVDAVHYDELLDRLNSYLQSQLGEFSDDIVVTGVAAVLGKTFAEMLYSTAESYMLAGGVITVMMVLLVGSLKLGLVTMIPSLIPITIVIAILYLIGIPLDIFTMLIGSIAIGLTVDDNVHFIHGFRRTYKETGDPAYAIERTLMTTGRAMLVTSIVLSFGFLIYTQSALNNMIGFGVMTALCIMLALVGSFLLAPALMMLLNKKIEVEQVPKDVGREEESQSVAA